MTVRAVYDTNVIVSAALKPGSIPAALVILAIEQRVLLYLSPPILEEYTEVLHRQKFGFEPHSVETFLDGLAAAVPPKPPVRLPVRERLSRQHAFSGKLRPAAVVMERMSVALYCFSQTSFLGKSLIPSLQVIETWSITHYRRFSHGCCR